MKYLKMVLALCSFAAVVSSCDMMHQDTDDCPTGLYVKFKYDYNMQHSDMFSDHVGSVTLYVFDENGKLVKIQEEKNTDTAKPLADGNYTMHVTDLPEGKYQIIALAGQTDPATMQDSERANFQRTDIKIGDDISKLGVNLEKKDQGETITVDGQSFTLYDVDNYSLPLDTLWHGQNSDPKATTPIVVEVKSGEATYTTLDMVRDTKKIKITLRELEDPTTMDYADYDFKIIDRNTELQSNNWPTENAWAKYTPYASWNTTDEEAPDGETVGQYGKMAHVEFMTSRLISHENLSDNARLIITHKETGKVLVNIDLISLLLRLRSYSDLGMEDQEFLDRENEYSLSFYLINSQLKYCYIQINALSWAVRVNFEDAKW